MKKKNIHVLIVDPHPEDAERLERMLCSAGVAAHVRADADAALEAFTTYQPDLVLVDEAASRHDKSHITRAFAGADLGRRAPIVLMSRSQKERRRRTRALTANGYAFHLRKPVQPDELLDMLMSLVPEALVIDVPGTASSGPTLAEKAEGPRQDPQAEGVLTVRRSRD